MKRTIIISIIAMILLIGIVIAQGFVLPSNFTINPNFAGLPTPQPNQKIFGCPYVFPIQLRDVKVWGYTVNGGTLNLNASFSLYSDNKRNVCGVRQEIISINLANWQESLASYIVTESESNINTVNQNNNNPISIGSSG